VCLPLLVFPCTIKSRSSLLAPAHAGGPGKRAVKRLCCGVVWCVSYSLFSNYFIWYCLVLIIGMPRDHYDQVLCVILDNVKRNQEWVCISFCRCTASEAL